MGTLSQREFRNRSGEVLRSVAAGESFVITNSGKPVGKLVPIDDAEPELKLSRAATMRGGFAQLVRLEASESSETILADLRGER